ncbi:MAG: BolA family transcriptional regulator [Rhodobacteraceae bacterium]|nr:BolA family transcriptional regulator [Paracoccaceae bacterium]
MTYVKRMHRKLTESFSPAELEIIDESEAHRGHGGYRDGGETHFKIIIRAAAFNDMSRVARQRAVMAALKVELEERVHALALDVSGIKTVLARDLNK